MPIATALQRLEEAACFVGWDVGGWNCDRNPRSRDALVILDSRLTMVGKPWRGNLRATINDAGTSLEWIQALFSLCHAPIPGEETGVVLAIDTPLGFSRAFVELVSGKGAVTGPIGRSEANPYLFRETERHLFRHGLKPLSPVKDMIGSQASKGMHVLARFARHRVGCGVWSDGGALTVIEAYPSACKGSATLERLRESFPKLGHEDEEDALLCALVGYLFARQPESLDRPGDNVPSLEGWIWVPADVLDQGQDSPE